MRSEALSLHFFIEKAPPQGCDLHRESCEHQGCLKAIEPQEVVEAVLRRLGRPPLVAVAPQPSLEVSGAPGRSDA